MNPRAQKSIRQPPPAFNAAAASYKDETEPFISLPPISNQMQEIDEALDFALNRMMALEDRLSCVMAPRPNLVAGEAKEPPNTNSPLFTRMSGVIKGLRTLGHRLDVILESVEL